MFVNDTIKVVNEEYARMISSWTYEDIYSFYNHDISNISSLLDGNHYVLLDDKGDIIGYYCYGEDARIPTIEEEVYDDDYLDYGLGLRPNLCGKGYGQEFVTIGINYARVSLDCNHLRLSVACFNERAIKIYKKVGFIIVREITNSYFLNKFYIMKYTIKSTK